MLGDWVFYLGLGAYFGNCAKVGLSQGFADIEEKELLAALSRLDLVHDGQPISDPHAEPRPAAIEHVSYRWND